MKSKEKAKRTERCPECKGSKKVEIREKLCSGATVRITVLCGSCHGLGKVKPTGGSKNGLPK